MLGGQMILLLLLAIFPGTPISIRIYAIYKHGWALTLSSNNFCVECFRDSKIAEIS